MSTIAIIANGTLLGISSTGSGGTFTNVPGCTKMSGPSIKFDLLDATDHNSAGYFREWVPGLADGDNVSAELNWRPSNAVHKSLRVDSYARTLRSFQLDFPDTTDNVVQAGSYISTIAPKSDIGTLLAASLTLKVTGEPTWS